MLDIANNDVITIVRGDDAEFYCIVNACNHAYLRNYRLKDDDALYFGVMEPHQPFEHALIRKKYVKEDVSEKGIVFIKLDSKDTVCLMPGVYYYEVKLQTKKGIGTIIAKRKFIVLE